MSVDVINIEANHKEEKPNLDKVEKPSYKIKTFLKIFGTIVFIFAIIMGSLIIFHNQYYTSFFVNGQSMYPTLNQYATDKDGNLLGEYGGSTSSSEGHRVEYGIMDAHSFAIDNLKRFDIVITNYENRDASDLFIKRVIALPGETFYFVKQTGYLYVDSIYVAQPIDDSYLAKSFSSYHTYNEQFLNPNGYTLGDDEYIVMGDNRGNSEDSRNVGPINKDLIVGKAVAIEGTCTIEGNTCVDISYTWPRWL